MSRKLSIFPALFAIIALIVTACSAGGSGGSGGSDTQEGSSTDNSANSQITYSYSENSSADFILGEWTEVTESSSKEEFTINQFVAKDGQYYKFIGKQSNGYSITIIYHSGDDRFFTLEASPLSTVKTYTFARVKSGSYKNADGQTTYMDDSLSGCYNLLISTSDQISNPSTTQITQFEKDAYDSHAINFSLFTSFIIPNYESAWCSGSSHRFSSYNKPE